MKEFLEKKQNKLLIVIAVLAIMVLSILWSLVSQIAAQVDSFSYPQSTLTDMPAEFTEEFSDATMSLVVSCATMDYTICLPESITAVSEKIVGTYGDLSFVVCESKEDMQTMISGALPSSLNVPVVGKPHQVNVRVSDEGYFGPYQAEYMAAEITTQISVRKVLTYGFAYQLKLEEGKSLYLYVSSEDKELLSGAKALLDKLASSVREYVPEVSVDTPTEEVVDNKQDMQEVMPPKEYTIYLESESIFPLENGVFLFEWMNSDSKPTELRVYAPDGTECIFDEELSHSGHYVYRIGPMEEGVFLITGTTKEQLRGALFNAYEWSFYNEQYITFGFEE